MALTASVSQLADSLTGWEYAEYSFATLVTIACFGEFAAEFTNWFTNGDEHRKKRLEKLSTLLLIFALALELVCLVRTNSISGQLIGKLSTVASTAWNLAMGATDEVSSLKATISSVKKQAEEAKAGLEEALLLARNAEQEANRARDTLADRTLSKDQLVRISEAIKPFAGQTYDLDTYWQIPECLRLADLIATAINKGGWLYVKPMAARMLLGGVKGVFINIHTDAGDKAKRAASQLKSALGKEGIEAKLMPLNPGSPITNTITLTIGEKTLTQGLK